MKHTLQDFARRLIQHATETGDPIDFAGDNNVLLKQRSHRVEPLFPDPFVYPYTDSYRDLGPVMERVLDGKVHGRRTNALLLNRVNSIRSINAIAIASGIPDRFRCPELSNPPIDILRRTMEECFI